MADTTASAILNKHLGSRATRAEESARPLQERRAQHRPPQEPSPASVPAADARSLPVTFAAPVILPQGDGSVKVLPGKPVQWLTSKQVATHFGLSQSTIYRSIEDGTLPPEMVQKPGKRKLRISAAALEHLDTTWRARRDAA